MEEMLFTWKHLKITRERVNDLELSHNYRAHRRVRPTKRAYLCKKKMIKRISQVKSRRYRRSIKRPDNHCVRVR